MNTAEEHSNKVRPQGTTDGELEAKLWKLIDKKCYNQAINLTKNYREYIIDNCMDIVPFLVLKVRDVDVEDNESLLCIDTILQYIAEVSKFKEAILALTAAVPCLDAPQHFCVLLKPIQICLVKNLSTECQYKHFQSAFSVVISFFISMELPNDVELPLDKRIPSQEHPLIISINLVLVAIYDFLTPFFEAACSGSLQFVTPVEDTKFAMALTYLQLFDKIAYLDVNSRERDLSSLAQNASKEMAAANSTQNISHMYTELIVQNITRLTNGNIFKLFKLTPESKSAEYYDSLATEIEDEDEDEETYEDISSLSLATLCFCVYSQGMSIQHLPCVYTKEFQFSYFLPLICEFLSVTHELLLHKGLVLTQYFIERFKPNLHEIVDHPIQYKFDRLISTVMTMSPNKQLRVLALNIFREYMKCFSLDAVYRLLEYLLQTTQHSGLASLVIGQIKEKYLATIKALSDSITRPMQESSPSTKMEEEVISTKFLGFSLWKLITLACALPEGARTDLLENSDKIFAALNTLIFFFLKARNINSATDETFRLDDMMKRAIYFSKKYLQPIRTCLEVSFDCHRFRLKTLEDDIKSGVKTGSSKVEFGVNVNDSLLPGGTPEQEKETIKLALTTFDMMSCVLSQCEDCVSDLGECLGEDGNTAGECLGEDGNTPGE